MPCIVRRTCNVVSKIGHNFAAIPNELRAAPDFFVQLAEEQEWLP
jgi:hypothetical protein